MNNLFTVDEKNELQLVAKYIELLPDKESQRLNELWQQVKNIVQSDLTENKEKFWYLLGCHLDAFFRDKPDPIPGFLTEEWQIVHLQTIGNYYIQLFLMVYQSERFLKKECETRNITYPFHTRSELLKCLMLERCLSDILRLTEDFYESTSFRNLQCAIPKLVDLIEGKFKIGKKVYSIKDRIPKCLKELENIKELLGLNTCSDVCFWNNFCEQVFFQNRNKIPAYTSYFAAMINVAVFHIDPKSPGYGHFVKYALIEGGYKESALRR